MDWAGLRGSWYWVAAVVVLMVVGSGLLVVDGGLTGFFTEETGKVSGSGSVSSQGEDLAKLNWDSLRGQAADSNICGDVGSGQVVFGGDGERIAVTESISPENRGIGIIQFSLKYGSTQVEEANTVCERIEPEQRKQELGDRKGVFLDYSLDGGETWYPVRYFDVDETLPWYGSSVEITEHVLLQEGAEVVFRVRQLNHDGVNQDVWAVSDLMTRGLSIDDVILEDDFDDGSIDSGKWSNWQNVEESDGGCGARSGQALQFSGVDPRPRIETEWFDSTNADYVIAWVTRARLTGSGDECDGDAWAGPADWMWLQYFSESDPYHYVYSSDSRWFGYGAYTGLEGQGRYALFTGDTADFVPVVIPIPQYARQPSTQFAWEAWGDDDWAVDDVEIVKAVDVKGTGPCPPDYIPQPDDPDLQEHCENLCTAPPTCMGYFCGELCGTR